LNSRNIDPPNHAAAETQGPLPAGFRIAETYPSLDKLPFERGRFPEKIERMQEKPLNKNEKRTRETRELLLRAAEAIFVRDGYERAELGEIATLAGRTKGAIYAQFKSKEDLFIALFAERMKDQANRMYEKLAQSTGIDQNLSLLRDFYIGTVEDQNWSLLLLEFKLFAIRHPESRERLQKARKEILPQMYREEEFEKFFGPTDPSFAGLRRSAAVASLGPILSALTVEARFEPELLDEETVMSVAGRLFDALLMPPTA
jgi:AcrR family transcriptional regulator